jgi:N-acetylneuraminic acid mutarotase
MLVFGGGVRVQPPRFYREDTWAFDGTRWVEIESQDHPSPRRYPAMGVDALGGHWYVYGGTIDSQDLDDLWRFDFATDTWTQLEDPMPPPRGFAASEWDPRTQSLTVFGGLEQPNFASYADGWRLRPQ